MNCRGASRDTTTSVIDGLTNLRIDGFGGGSRRSRTTPRRVRLGGQLRLVEDRPQFVGLLQKTDNGLLRDQIRCVYQFQRINRFVGLFDDETELVDEVRMRPRAAGSVIVRSDSGTRAKELV